MKILASYLFIVLLFMYRMIKKKNEQIIELTKKLDIYYNNYKQCLRALKENDPELAKYLIGRDKNER